ncbi:MAG: hypothetical protein CM15mP93_08130 [Thiotrichaceae bacterium]|nr:MAG: hypothetical protein CM15mP93_08130 [Thiotrichaceae bacterium]
MARQKHNFILSGAIDDLWINEKEEIHVVDYKSTAKKISPNLHQGIKLHTKDN